MQDHVLRRLRWFLLLGVILFSAAEILFCMNALWTASWLFDDAEQTTAYWTEENTALFSADSEVYVQLIRWAQVLLPLGFGTSVAACAAIAWLTKGRFRLASLFAGLTFLCLAIGLPFSQVWPRLHHPRFTSRSPFFVAFEQSGKPASQSQISVVTPGTALYALAPLLVLPAIFLWPQRADRRRNRTDDAVLEP